MDGPEFPPLRARFVRDSVTGDWLSLGTLIRRPRLQQLACSTDAASNCTLSVDSMFLIGALSATADFQHPVRVPDGYLDASIAVPHPTDGKLYLGLRDDPSAVGTIGN